MRAILLPRSLLADIRPKRAAGPSSVHEDLDRQSGVEVEVVEEVGVERQHRLFAFAGAAAAADRDATTQSQLYNFPTFANAMPFPEINKLAAADTHKPRGKYTILTTIARKYTNNIGYPGTTNAAIDEIFAKYLIPQMFAQVSQGKLSAEDSVRHTNTVIKNIYAKWRKREMM